MQGRRQVDINGCERGVRPRGGRDFVRRAFLRSGICAALAAFVPAHVQAQDASLPPGPIKIVLPTAAGGQPDTIARLLADRVTPVINRTFVIEPRAGAGGLIAGEYVARAAPDGQTLLFVTGGHTILPGLYARTIKFDAIKDFAFIAQISDVFFAIAVGPDHPAKTFGDLIELSRRKEHTFSSTGTGSTQHLIGELLKQQLGLQWTHVPYPGGAAPLNDVMTGRVDISVDSLLRLVPLGESGKLRLLAVSSDKRNERLPNVPALGEFSPGLAVGSFLALAAPAGTPPAIVARLNREIVKALSAEDLKQRLVALGNTPKTGSPEEVTALAAQYVARWTGIIQKLGIAH